MVTRMELRTDETQDEAETLSAAEDIDIDDVDAGEADEQPDDIDDNRSEPKAKRNVNWGRVVAFAVLPVVTIGLAAAAGALRWSQSYAHASDVARVETVQIAKDSTVAMLSYKSDTVEKQLKAAENGLSAAFRESYDKLIHDVVIPGAQQQHISTVAEIPAATSMSATPNHAVVLLFINQTATVGEEPPTNTASSVRVTMDKSGGRWLISAFDPI